MEIPSAIGATTFESSINLVMRGSYEWGYLDCNLYAQAVYYIEIGHDTMAFFDFLNQKTGYNVKVGMVKLDISFYGGIKVFEP